jgi:hypothetical protein
MNINSVLELPQGGVEINASFDQEESQFLLEFAINNLLALGITPFVEKDQTKVN